jgi:hypothetical protein
MDSLGIHSRMDEHVEIIEKLVQEALRVRE